MATGRLPDPNTAPLTAKGDLYTYSTVPAKLAVGSNGDTLVADSSTSTGLRYIPATVMANPVINGGMDIWQRGTSITMSGNVFTADRWQCTRAGGSGSGVTISRQATGDSTNLPDIQYGMRIQRDSGNTATTAIYSTYSMESANSIPFAGKTVTLSFYAKRGANFSGSGNTLSVTLVSGTGTDQNVNNGFTGQSTVASSTSLALTTTYQRFSVTGTVAGTATQLGFYPFYTPTGTAGANDWFEITGVQIDVGSVALPFRRSGGTLAGELAACQRYFQRIANGADSVYENIANGFCRSTTTAICIVRFITTMRVAPSLSFSNLSHFAVRQSNDAATTPTSIGLFDVTPRTANLEFVVSSGLVAGNSTRANINNSSSGTMDLSAEL